MGYPCIVTGCLVNSRSGPRGIPSFKFPEDEELRKVWVEKLERPWFRKPINFETARVCVIHFAPACLIPHEGTRKDRVTKKKRVLLKEGSVPTILNRAVFRDRLRVCADYDGKKLQLWRLFTDDPLPEDAPKKRGDSVTFKTHHPPPSNYEPFQDHSYANVVPKKSPVKKPVIPKEEDKESEYYTTEEEVEEVVEQKPVLKEGPSRFSLDGGGVKALLHDNDRVTLSPTQKLVKKIKKKVKKKKKLVLVGNQYKLLTPVSSKDAGLQNVVKHRKTLDELQERVNNLAKKLEASTVSEEVLKKENMRLKRELHDMEHYKNLNKLFSKEQIAVMGGVYKTVKKWDEETLDRSLKILMHCGPKGYEYLRSIGYALPSSCLLVNRIKERKKKAMEERVKQFHAKESEKASNAQSPEKPSENNASIVNNENVENDRTVELELKVQDVASGLMGSSSALNDSFNTPSTSSYSTCTALPDQSFTVTAPHPSGSGQIVSTYSLPREAYEANQFGSPTKKRKRLRGSPVKKKKKKGSKGNDKSPSPKKKRPRLKPGRQAEELVNFKSKLECLVCGRTFNNPAMAREHQRLHTGVGLPKCEICNKTFTMRSTLTLHMRVHNGVKTTCKWCNTEFENFWKFQNHNKRGVCKSKPVQGVTKEKVDRTENIEFLEKLAKSVIESQGKTAMEK